MAREVCRRMPRCSSCRRLSMRSGRRPSQRESAALNRLRHELGRLRLERYADSFREHGIEDWNQMLSIEEEDFKKLVAASEMPHNHADRLMESIKAERLRLNPQLSWYKEYR